MFYIKTKLGGFMKKSFLLLAGLLVTSFSSSIFSYVFTGVNLTPYVLKLAISKTGTTQDLTLAPYGASGYKQNLDMGGVNCLENVTIKARLQDKKKMNKMYADIAAGIPVHEQPESFILKDAAGNEVHPKDILGNDIGDNIKTYDWQGLGCHNSQLEFVMNYDGSVKVEQVEFGKWNY
jgi:hypothetical protein